MCVTLSSNKTQVQWNDSLSQAISYSYIQPEMKSLLRTGPPSKSQDAQGLGQHSQEWRLHNFSGPCIWSPPHCITGISPVANCVHYTGSAQAITQLTGCSWASSAAVQLFKMQVKDPGMILKLHHLRTQKRSCSAKCHSAKSCKERMKFLQALMSAAATVPFSARKTKDQHNFPESNGKELRLLLRKETVSYQRKYSQLAAFSFKQETDMQNFKYFCTLNEKHLKLIRDKYNLIH